jgi:hypothetical protein
MKAIMHEEYGPPGVLKFGDMIMLKPLWEKIWIGIFGLFIAFNLKKRKIGLDDGYGLVNPDDNSCSNSRNI